MSIDVMKQALEALEHIIYWDNEKPEWEYAHAAITALREALAQPEQEPGVKLDASAPLIVHPHPAFKKWQGLTDEELDQAMDYWSDPSRSAYGGADRANGEYVDMKDTWRYIEAKLKEKNT